METKQLTWVNAALACEDEDWSHRDWPDHGWPDDERIRLYHLRPPFGEDLRATPYHVVVLRCREPGWSFPRLMRAMGNRIRPVLIVSPCDDPQQIASVLRLGATSYLVDGDYTNSLLGKAIWGTAGRHTQLSPRAWAALNRTGSPLGDASVPGAMVPGVPDVLALSREALSPRERQIMELLASGFGTLEIGELLSLTEKTVRNNLSTIYAKLDARGRTDAVLLWLGTTPRKSRRPAVH
ncbi:LuxR C-terminal-related transcriptional regulator [Streptomyces sp. NPDC087850]|uniref:LuxR C-terminal-related transcriptional regulator n=1 Tax=unclassified Streptomyces TaxID=2593676 RepID=UPI0037F4AAC6